MMKNESGRRLVRYFNVMTNYLFGHAGRSCWSSRPNPVDTVFEVANSTIRLKPGGNEIGSFSSKAWLAFFFSSAGLDSTVTRGYALFVKLVDLQQIGDELAIKWDDGGESFVALEKLRRACPCASCQGEVDILGQLHKGPDKPLPPMAFVWRHCTTVGGYGIQPVWGDGHSSGIFSFDYLRRVAAV